MKRIAVIGAGALSKIFCEQIQKQLSQQYCIVAIMSRNIEHADSLAQKVSALPCTIIDQLLSVKPDIVVEFASRDAVAEYGETVLKTGCDLVVVSIGALSNDTLKKRLETVAKEANRKIYVPNGAVGGLDLMQTFAAMGPCKVEIQNTKAPKSLAGTPHLKDKVLSETEAEILFEGDVATAINGFPKNVNVAVASALASESMNTATVSVKSAPETTRNTHSIRLTNDLMQAQLTISSRPDPANPKSSTSTAYSVVALLKNLASPIQFF